MLASSFNKMEFIEKYCRIDRSDDSIEDFNEVADDEVNDSDIDFIDEEAMFQDVEPKNYRLMNVTREFPDVINNDSMAQGLDVTSGNPENFVSDFFDEFKVEYDEFQGVEETIRKFVQELNIFCQRLKDCFYETKIFAVCYHFIFKEEDFDFCQDKEIITSVLGADFFGELKSKKQILQLDLSLCRFETQCRVVNDLLVEQKLFLRVYELRNKFRYMIKKTPKCKNIFQRDLLVFIEEHFKGFHLVRKLAKNKMRQNFKPIDIVCKPVGKVNQIIDCYFSLLMRNAYRLTSEKRIDKMLARPTNKFLIERKSLQRHMNVSGSMPGLLYRFENQNILTFLDNTKFMGDVPFSNYFDFETTAGKKAYNFKEDVAFIHYFTRLL